MDKETFLINNNLMIWDAPLYVNIICNAKLNFKFNCQFLLIIEERL